MENKKPATCLEDIKIKTVYVDSLTDPADFDNTKVSTFTFTINSNDSDVKKTAVEIEKLKSNFVTWLKPMMERDMSKFIQVDQNGFNPETRKPFSDKNKWVNIFDNYGRLKKDDNGFSIIDLYNVNVSWGEPQFGPKNHRLHTHVSVDVEYSGSNVLLDRDLIQAYLNKTYKDTFGVDKCINFRFGNKTQDYKVKYLNYQKQQLLKVKNPELFGKKK